MARIVSPTRRMKTARHLLFARTGLRLYLTKIKRRKVVPQPAYPLETSSSREDWDNIDSDSTETDTDTDPSDYGTDVVTCDSDKARSDKVNIPTNTGSNVSSQKQTGGQDFNPPFDAKQQMEVLEDRDENMDEDMNEVVLIPTEIYAPYDQPTSDMVPPPTPGLSHIGLSLPSIESDSANGSRKELPDAFMEESKGGDSLSNANVDVSPFSMEIDECEDRSACPTKAVESEPKEVDRSDIPQRVSAQPWWPDFQNLLQRQGCPGSGPPLPARNETPILDCVAVHRDSFTRPSMADSKDEDKHKLPAKDPATHASSTENSEQPSRPVLMSTKQIKGARRTPLPNLNRIPGLTSVAIHRDDSTESSRTVWKDYPLPEQPPSLRPSNLVPEKKAQEEANDRIVEHSTDDMEGIEEDMLAEYKLRCRAHSQLDHEHAPCILRLDPYVPGNEEIRGRRPYDAKEILNIRNYRLHLPNWKRHAVWNRSILSIEVKLAPLYNVSGQHRTYMKYHLGRGLTGGDPAKRFWRHCNPRGNGCEAH
ncbi:hypothetical protein NA56DRAFT_686811 [Hyaloscypha hepaticicola]|uniref:Uncharacterized protein n=1 Tax=Hyaloscypha hepaticicola TaxID=2082293 RepID=A0A2J6QCM5_9HELO|nr:hypothetical protein NA56DRAFT_686811 [Hyaloscypha hepaticicola]